MTEHYQFSLMPLPYAYNALEPYIDSETVKLHHDKHLGAYVNNLNEALKDYPALQCWTLPQLLTNLCIIPCAVRTKIRNNAGGVYNHNLYFSIMGPPQNKQPCGLLLAAISKCFGSYQEFERKFKEASVTKFASGYCWLVTDRCGKLKILTTSNQDTPDLTQCCPLCLIDVWEHAYYLKYQNRRAEYVDNWFKVLDWDVVAENYLSCLSSRCN